MPLHSPECSPLVSNPPEASDFTEAKSGDPVVGYPVVDLDYFLKTHPPLGEDPRLWLTRLRGETEEGSVVVKGVESPQIFSEGGQKLYALLLGEAGDTEFLPNLATELEFDLEAALVELRHYGVLDESTPARVRLAREVIK